VNFVAYLRRFLIKVLKVLLDFFLAVYGRMDEEGDKMREELLKRSQDQRDLIICSLSRCQKILRIRNRCLHQEEA
jgi:hypothetical protein